MTELKKVNKTVLKYNIGGVLLLCNVSFLIFIGISPLFGIFIPGINLTGSVWNSLNGWLIYIIENLPDLIIGIFTNFKWQFLVEFINIAFIIIAVLLFLLGGIISFSKRNIYGLIGLLFFITSILTTIFTPFISNYLLEISFLSDPKTILIIIDTNIFIVLILGILGSYFSYFKTKL